MGTVDAHRKAHSIHAGVSHLSHVEMEERGDRLNKYKAKKCGLTSRRTADGSAIS